ncbi:MAG TPA: hypothetical protein VFQ45_01130, partial [Longimicrobium sp.]|nr:hypothetical protein [Longimicrobium sp.]
MWILLVAAFAVWGVAMSMRAGRRLALPALPLLAASVFVLRMLLAVANVSFGPLPGIDVDAVALLEHSERVVAQVLEGGSPYPWTHRYSYANVLAPFALVASGDALALLIAAFHALLWTAVLCHMAWIGRHLGLTAGPLYAVMLIAALHPPSLLYSAGALREAPLILCLAVYARAILSAEPGTEVGSWRAWAATAAGIYLHPGLLALVPLTLAMPLFRGGRRGRFGMGMRVA